MRSEPAPSYPRRRVFWFGMHKVLKPTELRRLRELGYEVFNPAYISPVYDQSADLRIDYDQPTTLPLEVFETLLAYDFFYRPIEDHIAEIIRDYFDVVIVTINSMWLKHLLEVFEGPVIYRVYGQHFSLSESLIEVGLWEHVMARTNFAIVPFAAESVENEHRWFLEKCSEPVPYQIPDDVFEYAHWRAEDCRPEIGVSLPNIQNPYFANAYREFSEAYPESYFRLYGPQRAAPADGRVMGALPRLDYLERLRRSAGYYYVYRDNVAYLPPIEMMEMRGPVVCLRGSLLSRFLGKNSPNVAEDQHDARVKLTRLIRGDASFSAELVASQEETRKRYDRSIVQPIFDRVMGGLLSEGVNAAPSVKFKGPIIRAHGAPVRPRQFAVALHADGLFEHKEGRPYAFEGIPRVVDTIVKIATGGSELACQVSCTKASAPVMYDFFSEQCQSGAVTLNVIDAGKGREHPETLLARLAWVEAVDADPTVTTILAPHYYLFPETLRSSKRLALYLPDYFPHLAPNEIFDETPEKDARNKRIGVAIATKADRILTNSEYTRAYLPAAGFTDAGDERVVVAPLPFLGADRAVHVTPEEEDLIVERLSGRPFLFYPTANRPNKQLAFLFEVLAELRFQHPGLGVVLTCDLNSYAPAMAALARYDLQDHVHLFPKASEGLLRWFYKNTVALCLTSNLEGNFPPQVLEALNYGAPVVATRLPTMMEILGEMSSELLLCGARDLAAFLAALVVAINDRAAVLERQEAVVEYLGRWNSPAAFRARLELVLPEMLTPGSVS